MLCGTLYIVYYPTTPGTYVPILFVPGLNGIVFPEFYSTVMANFASYGYIIAGIDPYYPAVDEPTSRNYVEKSLPEETFELLRWVSTNRYSLRLSVIVSGLYRNCVYTHGRIHTCTLSDIHHIHVHVHCTLSDIHHTHVHCCRQIHSHSVVLLYLSTVGEQLGPEDPPRC